MSAFTARWEALIDARRVWCLMEAAELGEGKGRSGERGLKHTLEFLVHFAKVSAEISGARREDT